MTIKKAQEIFKGWQEYMEIADKLHAIFSVVPEAFLPYKIDELEEGLNIIAKRFFDSGDKKTASNIQEMMIFHLGGYYLSNSNGKVLATEKILSDEEIIEKMKNDLDFMLSNKEILNIKLDKLKRISESWSTFRENQIID